MSEWTHNIVVIVPENLITEANALALAIGTSDADNMTFQQADFAVKSITDSITQYQNEDGELVDSVEKTVSYGAERYAVANTRAVDQIMDYFALIPAELQSGVVFPTMSISADGITTLEGSDMTKIQVFVDQEPFHVLSILGLARHEYI